VIDLVDFGDLEEGFQRLDTTWSLVLHIGLTHVDIFVCFTWISTTEHWAEEGGVP
jgi:hypothetical protein